MESFAQPWLIAGLTAVVTTVFAIIVLWQQQHISGLRSTCQGLLKQVDVLLQRQRELQKSIGGVADPFRLIGVETAGSDQA